MFNFLKRKQNINTELAILGLIMLINALSYGTIIPLLYPYSARFGITPVTLSFLFASYSFFQFLATPIMGRLSDRYGRKPLLLISLLGTGISLALFASATSILMLFIARILDGITGGNISVAQAMIADKVQGKDKARAFGMLGAAFGFGFLVGPALGGILSQFSLSAPFWFASILAFIGTFIGFFKLKESVHIVDVIKQKREPLFNIKGLFKALFNPVVGTILTVSLIAATVSNSFIIGFNAYSVDILNLSAKQIGIIYTMAGFMSVVMQVFGIKILLQKFKTKESIVKVALLGSFFSLLILGFGLSFTFFTLILFIYMLFHAVITPLVSAILSERSNSEDQGYILGVNQSYISLGQIVGPLSAGLVSQVTIPAIFIWSAILMYAGFLFIQFTKRTRSTRVNI